MDPWLEGHVWPDVHNSLAYLFKKQIAPQVVPKYMVRVSTYTVEDSRPEEEVGIMYPDVEILRQRDHPVSSWLSEPAAHYGLLTPSSLTIPAIEVHIPGVEIRDTENNRLITAIEILSPVNKRTPGIEPYREKRAKLRQDGVHLLEIDLIRRGVRPFNHSSIPSLSHYLVMLSRGNRSQTEVWAMTVRNPLPTVPVPLKSPDQDVRLDIGAAFNDLYEESFYGLSLRYEKDPPPPSFPDEETKWLRAQLSNAKRTS